MICYPIGTSDQSIVLSEPVLRHFSEYRQLARHDREAGGQLFARFDVPCIIVVEATGPRKTDRRTRTSYAPDRTAEQVEINQRAVDGLIWVGDWHTHPDDHPRPSQLDIASITECAERSSLQLNGLLLIVVGRNEPPDGLYVSIYEPQGGCRLLPSGDVLAARCAAASQV